MRLGKATTVSTCNKSREKPYAMTGRQTGATDTRSAAAGGCDASELATGENNNTSQSILGLKVLLF